MKTSSSIKTPEQMNVWLEILQRAPIAASRWTSTNAPRRVSSPMLQPYRLTKGPSATLSPSLTSAATQTLAGSSSGGISVNRSMQNRHETAAVAQRVLRGFQHRHHSRAVLPVGLGRQATGDTIDKVFALDLQRFGLFDAGDVDVAVAVGHLEVAVGFVVRPHRY